MAVAVKKIGTPPVIVDRYRIVDTDFGVSIDSRIGSQREEMQAWFRSVLRQFVTEHDKAPPKLSRTFPRPDRTWKIEDGRLLLLSSRDLPIFYLRADCAAFSDVHATLQDAEINIINHITTNLSNKLWIHGACLHRNRQLLMLVAPSGFGKTTLSLGLLQEGFKLLTDDIIIIDTPTAAILPYPRCPKIRGAAQTELLNAGFDLTGAGHMLKHFVILDDCFYETGRIAVSEAHLTVCFLRRSAGSGPAVTPLPASDAIAELAHHSNLLYKDPELKFFKKTFPDARFCDVEIGALRDNISQIEQICRCPLTQSRR